MGNKIVIAIIIVLIGVLFLVARENDQPSSDVPEEVADSIVTEEKVTTPIKATFSAPIPVSKQSGAKGRLVFAIHSTGNPTDKLEAILVPLESVLIHNTKNGWITLLKDPKTFDLLFINRDRNPELVLDINVGEGEYDRLRIRFGEIVVLEGNIATPIKSISDEFNVPFNISVEEGRDSALTLDFFVGKSIHKMVSGTYIFAPVFTLNSHSQISTIQESGSKVEFFGGKPEFNGLFGVDLNGIAKSNYSINPAFILDLANDVLVAMPYDIDRTNLGISAEDAINKVLQSKLLSNVTSVILIMQGRDPVWQIFEEGGGVSRSVFVDAMTGDILSIE